jgi:nitroreductase
MQLKDAEIEELIRLGGLAPSGGNTQPWQVSAHSDHLLLSLAPDRVGSFLDLGFRGSVFSVGSFIENVCLASTAMGLSHQVQVHEFRNLPDPVATIRYHGRTKPEQSPLFDQIGQRHTNRHLHRGPALPQASIDALRDSMRRWPETQLGALSELADKKRVAAILGKGNALLLRHPTTFGQMMTELRWSRAEADRTRDGVAISTLELPQSAVVLLHVLRRFPALRMLLPQGALEKMPEPAVLGSSHVCALSVRGELSTEALVNAGRALQRLWLTAASMRLSVQPLATLPFLVLRARQGGEGLADSETRQLLSLGADLGAAYSLQQDEFPLFIFRLASPAAAATDRALRLPPGALHHRA